MIDTQAAKQPYKRYDSKHHGVVITIDTDTQTQPIIAGLPQEASALSWEQAIYRFPTEYVAILDEDGQIVSANNCWLASSEAGRTPGLGLNYFDFIRLLLPRGQAQIVIANLKQLVRDGIGHIVANGDFDEVHAQKQGDIVAYRLVDSPNTLAVVHRFEPAHG